VKKARLEKLDPTGIPLSEVIELHRKFCPPHTIRGNLGDGYLIHFNPIYRRIREEVLRKGFRFTTENVGNYYSFPLMALDEVIAKKKIPYRKNFLWLPTLEKVAQKKFTLSEIKRSEIQLNYLFHESAHCIAHDVLFGSKSILSVAKTKETLLKILIGESFANTVECLSAIYAEGELGFFFLEANCHFRANSKEIKTLKKTIEKYGTHKIFLLLLHAFLYANYLYEKLGKNEIQKIFYLTGSKPSKDLKKIIEIGLQLDTEFRTSTTQLHLLKIGFPKRLEAFFQDPMDLLDKKAELREAIARFATLACLQN